MYQHKQVLKGRPVIKCIIKCSALIKLPPKVASWLTRKSPAVLPAMPANTNAKNAVLANAGNKF